MQMNTLIILLLCIIGKVRAQASTVGQNCSADISNPENDDRHEGYFDVYSQGAYGRSAVERLRSKPESYYQNLLDNAIMFLCDVPNASERCVEEDSPLAAYGCIKASDFECPTGLCERASNCYWNTVKAGQNRTTRFEVDAYAKAADALYGTKNSYLREIAEVGLIGIVISALLLISWILFFIGRYPMESMRRTLFHLFDSTTKGRLQDMSAYCHPCSSLFGDTGCNNRDWITCLRW